MEKLRTIEYKNSKKDFEVSKLELFLCPTIRALISKLPEDFKSKLEEIRLRINKPLMVYGAMNDYFVDINGGITTSPSNAYCVNKENIEKTLQFVSNYSIYAVEEEIKSGYITVQGGHRIGIVGKVIMDKGSIKTMKHFSGLNIRISREKIGASNNLLPFIISQNGELQNTLIVSPPQCGKTTLLRDIIREISSGVPHLNLKGMKVGVVDERSEIGACFEGIPQNDLGPRTDILDSCPKAQGIMILIRAMSPQVIATDEIGREEDSNSIKEAMMAGIKLITTVHGRSLEDVLKKDIVGKLIEDGVFERIVFLSNSDGVGTIESIINGSNLSYIHKHLKRNR